MSGLDKIKEGLKKAIADIQDRFDDKNFVDEPEPEYQPVLDEPEEDYDPYEDGSWGNNWFCIRCGNQLEPVSKDDTTWGKWCWDAMKKDYSLWYLCSNDKCCHHSAPLILHHPIGGYRSSAGDSYSISWVK